VSETDQARTALGSAFDRAFRSVHGRPDTSHVGATTIRSVTPILENAQTFVVQTYREREQGDWVFVEYVGTEGSVRIALPPAVTAAIGRQRDALTSKNRKTAARAEAQRRKAAGIKPGFLKGKAK
jgi:hypothetical protein